MTQECGTPSCVGASSCNCPSTLSKATSSAPMTSACRGRAVWALLALITPPGIVISTLTPNASPLRWSAGAAMSTSQRMIRA